MPLLHIAANYAINLIETVEIKMTRQYILIYKNTDQVYSDLMSYDDALDIKNTNNNLEMVEFISNPKPTVDYSVLDIY
jgi:hypothetical protein